MIGGGGGGGCRAVRSGSLYTYCFPDCFAVLSLRRKETEKRALVSQGVRKEASERSYTSGNTEIIHEQLSCVDLDENSVSDKTRRAHCVIKNNQLDDAPGADL